MLGCLIYLTSGVGDERIESLRNCMHMSEGETTGWEIYVRYMFAMLERWTNGGYIVKSDCLCVVRGEHSIMAFEVWI